MIIRNQIEKTKILSGIIEAPGLPDIYDQIQQKLGIDIRNDPHYVIARAGKTKEITYQLGSIGATDNDGISETIYSEYDVYRTTEIREIIDDGPETDPPTDNIINTKNEVEREFSYRKQDMLDKYYGNRKKEKEYHKRMKRYKSHIVDKNENGISYKTVEDYPEKDRDERFLQLEEFDFRLERLSRSEVGDYSLYERVADEYQTAINAIHDQEPLTREQIIELLRILDSDYIETNNYAYNQHQTTNENLKTLGKHGEKVPFLKTEKVKGQEQKARKIMKNVGITVHNAYLLGRNYIWAPIDAFLGRKVIAPIHELLYNSEKSVAGIYKDKLTHRYTARKMYFEQLYLEELSRENQRLKNAGKEEKKPSVFKLVFKPRLQAIFNYKKGNVAVLSSHANEIRKSIEEIAEKNNKMLKKLVELKTLEQILVDELESIEKDIKIIIDEDAKLRLNVRFQDLTRKLIDVLEEIDQVKNSNIDSVIQTDAVSMEKHDVANKSNITRTITGIKSAVRAAAMFYVGKNISKYVAEKITKTETIPERVVVRTTKIPGGKLSKESLNEITLGDLVDGANQVKVNSIPKMYKNQPPMNPRSYSATVHDKIRGIITPSYDGKNFVKNMTSASDLVTSANYARGQIQQLNRNSKLFDVLAETITKTDGKSTPVSPDELMNTILNAPDPNKALEDLIGKLEISVSSSSHGTPTGWLDVSNSSSSVIQNIAADKTVKNTVILPAQKITTTSTVMRKVLDKRAVAFEIVLSAGGIRDLYEIIRRAKSKEEMQKEGTHEKEIKSFQKNNHKSLGKKDYSNAWGFVGTKKGDYESDYYEEEVVQGRKR